MRVLVLALLLSTPVLAQPAPGSNMPAGFYPKSPCAKPVPPGKPAEAVNQSAMQIYNDKVKRFNGVATAFNDCTKAYVDNAQRDIAQIQAIVHAAVQDANTH
jgi:hypothetical protein